MWKAISPYDIIQWWIAKKTMKLLLQSLLQQILKLSVTKAIFKKIVNIDDFTANFSGCINCNYVVRSAIAAGKAAIF